MFLLRIFNKCKANNRLKNVEYRSSRNTYTNKIQRQKGQRERQNLKKCAPGRGQALRGRDSRGRFGFFPWFPGLEQLWFICSSEWTNYDLFALQNGLPMIFCSSEWTNYDCLCSDEHNMDNNNMDLSMSIDKTFFRTKTPPAERRSLDKSGRTLK